MKGALHWVPWVAMFLLATPASAQDETCDELSWFVAPEVHGSLLSNQTDRAVVAAAFGLGGRFGARKGMWGGYGLIEHDAWLATELGAEVVPGAVNVAAGIERFFFGGSARLAMGLGFSILAYDTELDEAGSFGLFFDFRPLGLRWPVGGRLSFVIDPLHFAVVAPVLDFTFLVNIEYRTTLGLEVELG